MFTAGDGGEIYQWDLRMTKKCLDKIQDEGNFHTTCIDISADGKHFASASKMGTVNIYSINESSHINPKPLKQIMNLTTSITDLKFHPGS